MFIFTTNLFPHITDLHLYPEHPSVTVTEGDDLTLTCLVYSEPAAQFDSWYQTGRFILGQKVYGTREKTLQIKNVSFNNTGEYVCSATNVGGSKTAVTTVQVLCMLQITINRLRNIIEIQFIWFKFLIYKKYQDA